MAQTMPCEALMNAKKTVRPVKETLRKALRKEADAWNLGHCMSGRLLRAGVGLRVYRPRGQSRWKRTAPSVVSAVCRACSGMISISTSASSRKNSLRFAIFSAAGPHLKPLFHYGAPARGTGVDKRGMRARRHACVEVISTVNSSGSSDAYSN